MKQKKLVQGYTFVILSAIIFGLMPIMAKYIYAEGVNAISLVFLRNFISVPVLAILALFTKSTFKISCKEIPNIIFVAIMGCCITPLLLFSSYHHIPSGTATVFHFIYPAIVVLGEFIFLKSKFKAVHIISTVLCITGIALFYNPNNDINLIGSFYALLSGITYAIYVISLSSFKNKKPSIFTFSFWVSTICSCVLLLVCTATNQLILPQSLSGWILTIFFSLSLNIGAVVLFQKGTFLIGGGRASILSTLEPITSILAGSVFFKETINIYTIFATILVIGASIIITSWDMRNHNQIS